MNKILVTFFLLMGLVPLAPVLAAETGAAGKPAPAAASDEDQQLRRTLNERYAAYQKETWPLQRKLHNAMLRLRAELTSEKPNDQAIEKMTAEINAQRAQLFQRHVAFLKDVAGRTSESRSLFPFAGFGMHGAGMDGGMMGCGLQGQGMMGGGQSGHGMMGQGMMGHGMMGGGMMGQGMGSGMMGPGMPGMMCPKMRAPGMPGDPGAHTQANPDAQTHHQDQ